MLKGMCQQTHLEDQAHTIMTDNLYYYLKDRIIMFFCLVSLFLSFLVIMICHLELFASLFILLVHYDAFICSYVSQKFVINIFNLVSGHSIH